MRDAVSITRRRDYGGIESVVGRGDVAADVDCVSRVEAENNRYRNLSSCEVLPVSV